jgi:hypothetical protein
MNDRGIKSADDDEESILMMPAPRNFYNSGLSHLYPIK